MSEGGGKKKAVGRPRKKTPQLVKSPARFECDPELGLTEMQSAFVWYYTEGACGQTEAARRAGFNFPGGSASKMLDGESHPNVVKAIRMKQDELRQKYAITPEKTGSMLWKIAETSFEGGNYNAAVAAVKELNQLAGLTIQRSQNLNINANVDKMDKNQIKERLTELLGSNQAFSKKDH